MRVGLRISSPSKATLFDPSGSALTQQHFVGEPVLSPELARRNGAWPSQMDSQSIQPFLDRWRPASRTTALRSSSSLVELHNPGLRRASSMHELSHRPQLLRREPDLHAASATHLHAAKSLTLLQAASASSIKSASASHAASAAHLMGLPRLTTTKYLAYMASESDVISAQVKFDMSQSNRRPNTAPAPQGSYLKELEVGRPPFKSWTGPDVVFDIIDKDKSGHVSRDELYRFFRGRLDPDKAASLFSTLDKDDSGSVSGSRGTMRRASARARSSGKTSGASTCSSTSSHTTTRWTLPICTSIERRVASRGARSAASRSRSCATS